MTWADAAYTYRKHITIDKTKVLEDLTDFPVLIKVTDANLAHTTHGGHCESTSGFDIVFYDADDATLLSHELVGYNHETGAVVFWVKKPILDKDADDTIHMYYGNSAINADQSSTNTWTSDYLLIAHGKDADTGHIHDSTSNANDGTKTSANNPIVSTSGKIHHAQDFSTDAITFENNVIGTGNKTVSQWAYRDADTGDYTLSSNSLGWSSDNKGIEIGWLSYGSLHTNVIIGNNQTADHYLSKTNMEFAKLEWHYIVVTQATNPVYLRVYVDGIEAGNTNTTVALEAAGDYNFRWGMSGGGTYGWDGKIEELRVSNVTKTAGWIHTEFHNQNDPATFMSFGAEETGAVAWTKDLADNIAIADAFTRVVDYQRTLTDLMTMSDYFARQVAYIRNISDSLTISDLILKSLGKNLIFSDSMSISDSILNQLGIGHVLSLFDSISILDTFSSLLTVSPSILLAYTGGSILLRKPYPQGASGSLSFSGSNFSFRSGNYASYIDEIDDENIVLYGYENDGAMAKFTALGIVADDGLEVTVTNLHDEFNGVYIIQNISYDPIGLDIFEYRLTLRFVRELP